MTYTKLLPQGQEQVIGRMHCFCFKHLCVITNAILRVSVSVRHWPLKQEF